MTSSPNYPFRSSPSESGRYPSSRPPQDPHIHSHPGYALGHTRSYTVVTRTTSSGLYKCTSQIHTRSSNTSHKYIQTHYLYYGFIWVYTVGSHGSTVRVYTGPFGFVPRIHTGTHHGVPGVHAHTRVTSTCVTARACTHTGDECMCHRVCMHTRVTTTCVTTRAYTHTGDEHMCHHAFMRTHG